MISGRVCKNVQVALHPRVNPWGATDIAELVVERQQVVAGQADAGDS